MKLLLTTLALIFSLVGFAVESKSTYLSDLYDEQAIERIAANADGWQPFPRCRNRDFWEGIPQETRQLLIQDGEQYLDYAPPMITLSDFRRVAETGDRQTIQKTQRKRRNAMLAMTLAECVEYQDRFTAKVADLLWVIVEESYWGSPAHLNVRQPEAVIVLDVEERFVELFNADTSRELTLISYFLDQRLDAITPRLRKRVYHEVNQRLFRTAPAKLAEFHTSLKAGKRVNNWAAWIGKNWLFCLLMLESDQEKLKQGLRGVLQMLDTYIAGFPADGSVSEGPGYWSAGAGRLYNATQMLRQLDSVTDPYADEFIVNILEFIAKVHIGGDHFVSNADTLAKITVNPYLIADMAVTIDSPLLARLALAFPPVNGKLQKTGGFDHFKERQYELFSRDKLSALQQSVSSYSDSWLPDLQLMLARSTGNNGFTLTAKAGHNDESHNHNDVGVFAIYLNHEPLIVDPGKRLYVLTTFTDKRYEPEHWNHNSWSHNLPVFGGVQQRVGKEFRAEAVEVDLGETQAHFSADLHQAYPKEAHLKNFHRDLQLHRDKGRVMLTDEYQFTKALPVELTFMTPAKAEAQDNRVLLILPTGEQVNLSYDPEQMDVVVEKMPMTDRQMLASWGQLNKVTFKSCEKLKEAKWRFEFSWVK